MAFCDNIRCRWHNANGAQVVYVKPLKPMRMTSPSDPFRPFEPIGEYDKVVVNNHLFYDVSPFGPTAPVQRFFCDECKELVAEAFEVIREIRELNEAIGRDLPASCYLIAAVERAWLRREKSRSK